MFGATFPADMRVIAAFHIAFWGGCLFTGLAQVPENLVVDGIPAIPPALRADAGRYLEFRTAALQSWHPVRREMLVTTRFADSAQLHLVRQPGGARRQLTFFTEPVAGAQFGRISLIWLISPGSYRLPR